MYKRAKYLILFPVLLVFTGNVCSQTTERSFYFWKLHSINGEARINGLYREQRRIGMNIYDYEKSSYFSGGLFLNMSSSFLNKNFLLLDINGGYMPETSRNNFIVVPDQAEVSTYKKAGINVTFLREKKINLSLFGNYDENFSRRENLTDLKTISKHLGAVFNVDNNILPFRFDYHNRNWLETEIQAGRQYSLDQNIFSARTTKSLTEYDRNELSYSHDENTNVNQNLFRVANTVDNIDFFSLVYLDRDRKSTLNTMASNFNQHGNIYLQRFQASENFNIQFPLNLTFWGNYSFHKTNQNQYGLIHHSVNSSLSHQLYKSLQSSINMEYHNITHTVYKELITKAGVEFNYTKKIPSGNLIINYRFDRYHQTYSSEPSDLKVSNEQYMLNDNKISLFRLPNVKVESVIVRDSTGTINYVNGLDFFLIERNQFIEIRRIPGGLITNNSLVFVEYIAIQPGAYKYDANTHIFDSNIYLLDNILNLNYHFSSQNYSNLEKTDFITLNYFTQNQIGCRLNYKMISGGAEYEDYRSSLLPYQRMRYYLNFQKSFKEKIVLLVNSNLQNYVMLDQPESKYQNFMDVTGKIIYPISKHTNLNVDCMYRKQSGRGIDLNLLTTKTEITSSVNFLLVTLGMEMYRRNYIGEKINFLGTYIKMVRKF